MLKAENLVSPGAQMMICKPYSTVIWFWSCLNLPAGSFICFKNQKALQTASGSAWNHSNSQQLRTWLLPEPGQTRDKSQLLKLCMSSTYRQPRLGKPIGRILYNRTGFIISSEPMERNRNFSCRIQLIYFQCLYQKKNHTLDVPKWPSAL